jgi:tRNA(adenine34) deaminase
MGLFIAEFVLEYLCARVRVPMNQIETTLLPRDASFMKLALQQAHHAGKRGEVPVGAVVVYNDQIVGSGYNRREEMQSPLAHAEILALDEASRELGYWRLTECDLYVTLEPCIMCAGAILQGRLRRVIFGCLDPKAGAVISLYRLCDDRRLNHQIPATAGVLAKECATVLSEFFSSLREQKRITRCGEVAEPG